jgi:hypothetical protein
MIKTKTKFVFNRTKKINIKLRYVVVFCICQVLNKKRNVFSVTDYCQVNAWRKINKFVNLNKDYNIKIEESEFLHCSDRIKIVDKNSMILIDFVDNKIKDFNIVNLLQK